MKSLNVCRFSSSRPDVVPAPAEFLPATHLRDRVDEAAIEQREQAGREHRIGRNAVGAVAVLQQRRRAVAPESVPAVHDRDRHLLAVARRRPQVLGRVACRIEIAEHGLALQQPALTGPHVVVVGGAWRRERRVGVAHDVAVHSSLSPSAARYAGSSESMWNSLPAVPGPDAHLAQPARALLDREETREHLEARNQHVVAVADHFAPALAVASLLRRGLEDAEVARAASCCGSPSGRRRGRPEYSWPRSRGSSTRNSSRGSSHRA